MKNYWILLVITFIACSDVEHPIGSKPNVSNLNNKESNASDIYSRENIEINYIDIDSKKFYNSSKILEKRALVINDSTGLAKAYSCLGRYYFEIAVFDSSYLYYFKAKKILIKNNNLQKLSELCNNIADVQFAVSDYTNCEKTIFEGLRYFKGNEIDKYYLYNLLGIVYCETREYEKSLEYHGKALKILNSLDLKSENQLRANTLNNIGNIYQYKQNYKKSLSYFNLAVKSQNLFRDSPSLYAILHDNIAYSSFKINQLSNVPEFFYKALKIRDSINHVKGIIITKIHLSEYYQSLHSKQAIKFASEARDLSIRKKLPLEILESLKQLILVDPKNAPMYSQQYIKINDSMQLAERKIRNKFARIAYETDEIIVQKDDAITQKWIVFWCAFVVAILGALGFIIKLQKAKQKELVFLHDQQKSNEAIYGLIHDRQTELDEVRHAEKQRVARDLHDGVMNKLASTRLNLYVLTKQKDKNTLQKCLDFIDGIQDIEKEIRRIAHDLDSDIFSKENSFNSAMNFLFNDQKSISAAEIHAEIDTEINWEPISSIIKINLYRILQEALQNCHKYASAQNIFVTITRDEDLLHLMIQDDGVGFNPKKIKSGIGLKNMRARADILLGKFRICGENGTVINISFPITQC